MRHSFTLSFPPAQASGCACPLPIFSRSPSQPPFRLSSHGPFFDSLTPVLFGRSKCKRRPAGASVASRALSDRSEAGLACDTRPLSYRIGQAGLNPASQSASYRTGQLFCANCQPTVVARAGSYNREHEHYLAAMKRKQASLVR